ncbi:MAG: hypothetical protein BWY82_01188 [Verrucomicrobia bacterium ADurb.Bin474]|nr:MAG: hypothetical protein BWY82_01188 [Verrucomicrobia bacterium ADurb.Bin474]
MDIRFREAREVVLGYNIRPEETDTVASDLEMAI